MISLKQRTIAIATAATVGLLASAATTQDSAQQSVLEEAHQSYESAVNSQNYESIAGMFSDDAFVLPLTGGVLRGPEEIRQHFEEMQVTSMEVTSNVVKDVGDSIVIDTG